MSAFTRYFRLIFFILLIPALLMTIIAVGIRTQDDRERARAEATQIVQDEVIGIAERIERTLTIFSLFARSTAPVEAMQAGNMEPLVDRARVLEMEKRKLQFLLLLNARGEVAGAYPSLPPAILIERAKAVAPYASGALTIGNDESVLLHDRIEEPSGQLLGYIVSSITPHEFRPTATRLAFQSVALAVRTELLPQLPGQTCAAHALRYAGATYAVGLCGTVRSALSPMAVVRKFLTLPLLAFVGSLLMALLLAHKVAEMLQKPIMDLQRFTQLVDEKDQQTYEQLRQQLMGRRDEFGQLAMAIHAARNTVRKLETQKAQLAVHTAVASQVAHDIRSPLAALEVAMAGAAALPEEQRLLVRRATARIRDIANNLMGQSRATSAKTAPAGDTAGAGSVATEEVSSVELLSSLIDPLVTEKRLQHRALGAVEIQADLGAASYGLFAQVQPTAFKRVLSNLVNNAVEGIAERGTVQVRLRPWEGQIWVAVQDTGKGIAAEVLPQLMARGATFGKAGGSGLGLFHARERVEGWGGTLAIQSTVGQGTTVTLRLPAAPPPAWFVPSLTLRDGLTIVVLDDDPSIHDLWAGRLAAVRSQWPRLTVQHFTTADATCTWYAQQQGMELDALYLVDYELLGQPANGLALIEKLQIPQQAILVTSRYEEPAIRDRCAALGVRLIPKGLAGFVPIVVEAKPLVSSPSPQPASSDGPSAQMIPRARCFRSPLETVSTSRPQRGEGTTGSYRVLLIDDDLLIAQTWAVMRKSLQIGELVHVANLEALQAQSIDPATFDVAFVDKHLDGSAHDGAATIAWLRAHGARRIVLASGERADKLRADPRWASVDAICEEKLPSSLAAFVNSPSRPGI